MFWLVALAAPFAAWMGRVMFGALTCAIRPGAAAINSTAARLRSEREIVILLIERLRVVSEFGRLAFAAFLGGRAGRGGGRPPPPALATRAIAATREHHQLADLDLGDVLGHAVLLVFVGAVLDAP